MDFPISKYLDPESNYNYISDTMYWIIDGLLYAFVLVMCYLVYYLLNQVTGKWIEHTGKIIDKLYRPSTLSTGAGIGMTTGGQMATVTTTSGSGEEWFVMVRTEDGAIEKIYCSDDWFYNHNIGDQITYQEKFGGISKKSLSEFRAVE